MQAIPARAPAGMPAPGTRRIGPGSRPAVASSPMRPLGWRAHLGGQGGDVTVDVTAGRSLPKVWAERFASEPSAPSVYVSSGEGDPADRGRWVSAGELDERSRDVASRLIRLGLGEHARILWNADRSLASVVASLAVLRAGQVLVPLDPKLTERELRHVVDEVRPALSIVDDPRPRRPARPDDRRGRSCGPGARHRAHRSTGCSGPRTRRDRSDGRHRRLRTRLAGAHRIHIGDDGGAEGRGADSCQPARQCRSAAAGVGLDT